MTPSSVDMNSHCLPTDILPSIFKELTSQRDLYSVCLTSRIFRIEGQIILFRNPGVLTIGVGNLPDNSFLDAVIDSPDRLARIVRSYEQCIAWNSPFGVKEGANIFFPAIGAASKRGVPDTSKRVHLIKKMGYALRLLVNLKVLKIWDKDRDQNHFNRPYLPDILQYCRFQLNSLTWDLTGEKAIISQFLPHQKNLKELELGRRYIGRLQTDRVESQQLTGICLCLESLSGSIAMTSLFLVPNDSRRRPVKCLRWTSNPEGYWQKSDIQVGQLTNPLRSVKLLDYDCEQRHPSLSSLSPILGKLKVLRMCVEDLSGTSRMWKEDILAIGRLPTLRTLILSISKTRNGGVPHQVNYDAATKISERIFLHSNTLQIIDISGLSSRTERYTRPPPSTTFPSVRIGSRTILSVCDEYSWSNRHSFLDY